MRQNTKVLPSNAFEKQTDCLQCFEENEPVWILNCLSNWLKFRYKIFRSEASRSPEYRDKMDREDL